MIIRPIFNGVHLGSANSFTELPYGQTKSPNWTNYPRLFVFADDLSIWVKYDNLMLKLHMKQPKKGWQHIKISMKMGCFGTISATFEDEASAENALYYKKMGG